MSIRTFRNLFCDLKCGQWHDGDVMDGATASEMRAAAKRAGWTVRTVSAGPGYPSQRLDICPACTTKSTPTPREDQP